MAILYHWRDTIFRRDTASGRNVGSLEQNARWLEAADEAGERLWAFTRNTRGEYVLALTYTVSRIRATPAPKRYGAFSIVPVSGSQTWFDVESSPSVETIVRELSISTGARTLGHSFQGRGAVRHITPADDRVLANFAKDLPVLGARSKSSRGRSHTGPSIQSGLTIEWNDVEWFDLIPYRFFDEQEETRDSHSVARRTGGNVIAHCVVTTRGKLTTIDYTGASVVAANRGLGLDKGTLYLKFTTTARDELTRRGIGWREADSSTVNFGNAIGYWPRTDDEGDYRRPRGAKAMRRVTSAKDRAGQPAFRSKLLETYASCCLTGNRIPEALEASHIDDFEGKEFDHAQNGLLLRRDLHALFDRGLLAFHPTTGLAHFATDETRQTYVEIHRRLCLRKPYARFAKRSPSKAALTRRWKKFARTT